MTRTTRKLNKDFYKKLHISTENIRRCTSSRSIDDRKPIMTECLRGNFRHSDLHTHTHVHASIHLYTCVHIHTYVYTHINMYAYIITYLCTCIHVHTKNKDVGAKYFIETLTLMMTVGMSKLSDTHQPILESTSTD